MWQFFSQLLALFKDKKYGVILGGMAIAMVVAAAAYGQVKLQENTKQITKLKENQGEIVATLKVMQVTLQNVNETVKRGEEQIQDTAGRVEKTQEKVLEIYRNVYEIKLKQQQNP